MRGVGGFKEARKRKCFKKNEVNSTAANTFKGTGKQDKKVNRCGD